MVINRDIQKVKLVKIKAQQICPAFGSRSVQFSGTSHSPFADELNRRRIQARLGSG